MWIYMHEGVTICLIAPEDYRMDNKTKNGGQFGFKVPKANLCEQVLDLFKATV